MSRLILMSLLLAGHLSASTIYSNVSAAFPGTSTQIHISPFSPYFGTAFTATDSGALGSVQTEITSTTGQAVGVTLGLYADSGGQPGALLESWSFQAPPDLALVPATAPLTQLNSAVNPALTAGLQYWLVFTGGALELAWYGNDTGVAGGTWLGGTLTTLGQNSAAFPTPGIIVESREAAAIPEPPASLLLAGGLALLAGAGRRRR